MKSNIITRGLEPEKAKRAVILIHGRGAPAEDILGLADFFDDCHTHFAAPEADNYTWYPNSFLAPRPQNQPGLDGAIETIGNLIISLSNILTPEKLFIMGFSQGACLTAEVTSQMARKYGGIAILTGGLIGHAVENQFYHGDFSSTKVYLSNGDHDPHIPLERTEETYSVMRSMGADVKKEIFPGRQHTITMHEINTVRKWILQM